MMKRLAKKFAARIGTVGAIASAVLFALPAFAQDSRLSLADRVTRLEQQTQSKDQGNIGMVNQMQQLQAQVQQLQGQIEELQHQLQQLDDKNKAQYADLDARLGRMEGGNYSNAGAVAPVPGKVAPAPAPASAAPAASASTRSATSSAGTGADSAAAQAAYTSAFQAIRGGNYVDASRQFRSFIQQYPDNALASNALYWLGESYYATTNYPVALQSFQQLLSQFPQSEKAPDALLKVGYSQIELKQLDAAKATLKQVSAKYPGSRVASLAAERLQRLQLQSSH
ncbi:MAG: tol-pal system protein YbgF [Rhodanobacter sp.]